MPANSAGLIEQQIADWIREHVAVAVAGRGRCKRLVLRQMSLESKPQGDVNSFNIPQDEGLAGETDMLVNRIVDAAQRDANDFEGGVQKYALFAYYSDDPNYVPRKIFRVAADDEVTRDLSPSEPPTEKGLVSQVMRHLEAVMRTSTVSTGVVIENMTRQLRDHQEAKKVTDKQTIDLMLLVQANINEAHRRRLDERKEEMEMGIKEGLFEQLKVAVPIILNRISGKPLLPEQDKSFMLMAALLENLRPEQQTLPARRTGSPASGGAGRDPGRVREEENRLHGEQPKDAEWRSPGPRKFPAASDGTGRTARHAPGQRSCQLPREDVPEREGEDIHRGRRRIRRRGHQKPREARSAVHEPDGRSQQARQEVETHYQEK